MDEIESFTFDPLETQLDSFASRDRREMLLQWNLDQNLKVQRFRFTGGFSTAVVGEYERLIKDFFRCAGSQSVLDNHGTSSVPTSVTSEQLNTNVLSLDFFDKFTESGIVLPSGNIRGCFEETFDGIPIGMFLYFMCVYIMYVINVYNVCI